MKEESLNIQIVTAIKTKCREQHIKISELLRAAGTSQHLIDDWQNERSEPSFPVLNRICAVLNIEIEELFTTDQMALTDSQRNLLNEWHNLSSKEKSALFSYIEAMKANH